MLRVEFNVPAEPAALEAVLGGLVAQNLWQLGVLARRGMHLSRLYHPTTRIRYRRDPPGSKERFRSLARVYMTGWGDCDDLVGIICAERWFFDREATRPRVVPTRIPKMLHALVERADGSIEDPSRIVRRLRG